MVVLLDFKIRFTLISGLHITGDRAELWADKSLALDWYKGEKPLVPATSIKGWLRENAERVLRSLGKEICDGSQPSNLCGRCLICQVFGHPRGKAQLLFEDGKFKIEERNTRTSVSLSRHRKTAYEERLFTTEVVWGQMLTAEGRGFFPSSDEARRIAALLWLATRAGFALGGARSRGLGWLELKEFTARCDGQEITEAVLKTAAEELTR